MNARIDFPVLALGSKPDARITVGIWNGLTAGDGVKHRGQHVALLDERGVIVAITGPADDPASVADAHRLATLWNLARDIATEELSADCHPFN